MKITFEIEETLSRVLNKVVEESKSSPLNINSDQIINNALREYFNKYIPLNFNLETKFGLFLGDKQVVDKENNESK